MENILIALGVEFDGDIPHRVRPIIRHLNYGALMKAKILPEVKLFTQVPFGKLPSMAGKVGYSQFGLIMEEIFEGYILQKTDEEIKERLSPPIRSFFKSHEFQDIKKMSRRFQNRDDVRFQVELSDPSSGIAGHPDLTTTKTIYDIKTTTSFAKMRTDTILQILSYFCLARVSGNEKMTHVGVILPAQNMILNMTLKYWNWRPFYELLKEAKQIEISREKKYNSTPMEFFKFRSRALSVGMHVHKNSLIGYILQGYPYLQFFVGGTKNTNVKCTKSFMDRLKRVLQEYPKAKVFIHSPYTLNLSKKYLSDDQIVKDVPKNKKYAEGRWVYEATVHLLKMGEDLGLKGIVIHCGKRAKRPEKEAVDNMREHVNIIAVEGSERCPLLIETSSGEDGEILCGPNELSDFYWSLQEDARKNVAICVDTCHVYAAGYEPMEFIKCLEERKVPIKLIHYNDSWHPKGSKLDRHAQVHFGWIGIEQMQSVLEWGITNNVPMVSE